MYCKCGNDNQQYSSWPRWLKELGKTKYSIQRSKGLGENTAEMMSKTTMNPATRRLIAITPAEAEATARIFDTLLGVLR